MSRDCRFCGESFTTVSERVGHEPGCQPWTGAPTKQPLMSTETLDRLIYQLRHQILIPNGLDAISGKILEEASEFDEAPSLEEAGDVLICLLSVTMALGLGGLDAVVDAAEAKMRTNLASDWRRNDRGTLTRLCKGCGDHICSCHTQPQPEGQI